MLSNVAYILNRYVYVENKFKYCFVSIPFKESPGRHNICRYVLEDLLVKVKVQAAD